jgi:hypothetical protein
MQKKWTFGVILVLLFLVGFSSASVDVLNYSIDKNYTIGQNLSGYVELNISDVLASDLISFSENNQEISWRDFLVLNDADVECMDYGCTGKFLLNGAGSETKQIVDPDDNYLGILLTGQQVFVSSLNFSMSSNFDEGLVSPLEIELFGGDYVWH